MDDISKIFILDNVKSVRARLQLLLSTIEVNVIEASNSFEFFNIFLQNRCDGNLIIIDIELRNEDGFEVIRKIRDKNKNIPIIILTANNNREIFIKGVFEGATDYILKPFDDIIIKDKILKILHSYNNEKETDNKIIFNIPFFLQSEFMKSKKGKYSTSVMMTALYNNSKTFSHEEEKDYFKLSGIVYDELKDIFWETDIFTKYGSQSFVGVFPFADKESVGIISNKINGCFNELKQKKKTLQEYYLANVFLTYPEDVTGVDEVITKLIEKTKETIKLSKETPLYKNNIEK